MTNLGPADSIWRIPGNDDLLKKLWGDGLSASQIFARIPGASRNAVIGRVHRLGLSGRNRTNSNPTMPRLPRAATPRSADPKPRKIVDYAKDTSLATRAIARRQRAEQEPAEVIDLPADQSADAVTFLARDYKQCAWPLNDVTPIAAHMVCGSGCYRDHSYCLRHYRLGSQAARPRTHELSDDERARRVQQGRKNLANYRERLVQA